MTEDHAFKIERLLWFRLRHAQDGTIRVESYHPSANREIGFRRKGNSLSASGVADMLVKALQDDSAPRKERRRRWKLRVSSTERIIAQVANHGMRQFKIHYYSVCPLVPDGRPIAKSGRKSSVEREPRVASFFVLDARGDEPVLSSFFDYSRPVNTKGIAEFFGTTPKALYTKANGLSFKIIWDCAIVLRETTSQDTERLGLHVKATLFDYPEGRLIGGLPIGSEKQFLAICALKDWDGWKQVTEGYHELFRVWNLICSKGSKLVRVFIKGEPGSGKELWFKALREGTCPHRQKSNWRTLSETLETNELRQLLFGVRSGGLEQPGFLTLCSGGGVFIDEIGKSRPEFRKDLLRVLEAKEFIPIGGPPTQQHDVLFVFASTPADQQTAFDPPDFWTRMDAELCLPSPITLVPKSTGPGAPFSAIDSNRFYALFAMFWSKALQDHHYDAALNLVDVFGVFDKKVFTPLLKEIAHQIGPSQPWPSRLSKRGIPVSPRRVEALARALAAEWRWLSYKQPIDPLAEEEEERIEDVLKAFRKRCITDFLAHIIQDKKNLDSLGDSAMTRANARPGPGG